MFDIHYNTGAGDKYGFATLEEAMKEADEGACYTQQDITILKNDELVAMRVWYGTEEEEGEENVISYGSFGHYADWVIL